MDGFRFNDLPARLTRNAMKKTKPDTPCYCGMNFDVQQVVVTRRRFELQVTFNDREQNALFLPVQKSGPQLPKEFITRGFEYIQVAGVIDVITQSGFGVGNAMVMAEHSYIHGDESRRRQSSFNRIFPPGSRKPVVRKMLLLLRIPRKMKNNSS